MSSNHDRPAPPKSPKAELLGELESIKGLLEDDWELDLDIDIPILSDVVTAEGEQQPSDLLDLKSIFEDDDTEPSPLRTELSPAASSEPSTPQATRSAQEPSPPSTAASETSVELFNEPLISPPAEPYSEEQGFEHQICEQQTSTQQCSDQQSSDQEFTEQPTAMDSSFEALENYSLDDLRLDELNLEGLNLEDLDASIQIPSFKLSTALSNQLLSEQAEVTEPNSEQPLAGTKTEEEQEDMFFDNAPSVSAPNTDNSSNAVDMDLLIQEIVDDFIPTIEAALREKLSQCSADVIKQLAEKHLQH